jgi:FkbH-like protein
MALGEVPGALVVDAEEAVRQLGAGAAVDHRLGYLADMPYRDELLADVAGQVVRAVGLTTRVAPKVYAVDADNTLWAGEAADLANIAVDGPAAAASRDLQRLLADARRAGALLALCSKNVEADVKAALELPGMVLAWDDFSATSVGWDSKVEGLQQLASELNLGLDDFVFIDDNPVEVMEVAARLPQVRTVLLPSDPTQWPEDPELLRVLDRLPPTADDVQRADRYAAERHREAAQRVLSEEDFRARLAAEARVFEPGAADLARFAQLLQRTNQFRLTTARFDEAELARFAADDRALLRLLEAWDSFGAYGIVGAAVVERRADGGHLLAFAISCRALGRGVEEAFLADVAEDVRARWAGDLVATFEDTGRNEPAMRFFKSKGVDAPDTPTALRDLAWPSYVRRRESGG